MTNIFFLFFCFISSVQNKNFLQNKIILNSKCTCNNENNDKYIFNNLTNIHMDYINKLNMTQVNANKKYSFLRSNKNNTYIRNVHFSNNLFRKVRMSQLYSDNQQMFNSVWYPQYKFDTPILSLDIAKFNDKAIDCLINLYEVKENKYCHLFDDIKEKYANKYNTPEHKKRESEKNLNPYVPVLGNSLLHLNLNGLTDFTEVENIYSEYLDKYLTIINQDENNSHKIEFKHKIYNFFRNNIEKQFITKNFFNSSIIYEINKYNL